MLNPNQSRVGHTYLVAVCLWGMLTVSSGAVSEISFPDVDIKDKPVKEALQSLTALLWLNREDCGTWCVMLEIAEEPFFHLAHADIPSHYATRPNPRYFKKLSIN